MSIFFHYEDGIISKTINIYYVHTITISITTSVTPAKSDQISVEGT